MKQGIFYRDDSVKDTVNGYEIGTFITADEDEYIIFVDHSAKKVTGNHNESEDGGMHMYVLLSSCGNPDYRQDPDQPLPGVSAGWKKVSSLEEASSVCRQYIEHYDLGGGNWNGGYVFNSLTLDNNTKQLAYISYNGRIWTDGEYKLECQYGLRMHGTFPEQKWDEMRKFS